MGHSPHAGLRAVHTSAPKSMRAWLKSNTRLRGTIASETTHRCFRIRCDFASPRPTTTRKRTRATLVSRIGARLPNAKLIIAPAVYGPMPLNERRTCSSAGSEPPKRVTASRAMAWRRRGRML